MKPLFVLLSIAVTATSCARQPEARRYSLQGQVLSVEAGRGQATIKHEDIKGLMPAMTMPYTIKDTKVLAATRPGDLINATLVVESNDAYLIDVRKVGEAPVEKPATDAAASAAGSDVLKPGDLVPNAHFVDETGTAREIASFKGSPLVLTFMYTTCPLPTFCPMMDRHFKSIQNAIDKDSALKDVHLASISFDPDVDTPAVLRKHASELGADPKHWTFLTGTREAVDAFGASFGLRVDRGPKDARDITHNLRTALVDREGKLVKVYIGNEWTPDMVLADLKPVAAAH